MTNIGLTSAEISARNWVNGDIVFNKTTQLTQIYNNGWVTIGSGGGISPPTTVSTLVAWNGVFTGDFVVGTVASPISDTTITVPNLSGAVEGAQIEIYWNGSSKPAFPSATYIRTDGMDVSINTLNRIILTYKGGVVHVEAARILALNSGTPTITGSATLSVGNIVTVSTLGQAPRTTYQWQRLTAAVWGDIGGATSATYTVVAGDSGKSIRCNITYKDDMFESTTVSTTSKNVS